MAMADVKGSQTSARKDLFKSSPSKTSQGHSASGKNALKGNIVDISTQFLKSITEQFDAEENMSVENSPSKNNEQKLHTNTHNFSPVKSMTQQSSTTSTKSDALSFNHELSAVVSADIDEMEKVRYHLHTMLRSAGRESPDSDEFHSETLTNLGDQGVLLDGENLMESMGSVGMSTLIQEYLPSSSSPLSELQLDHNGVLMSSMSMANDEHTKHRSRSTTADKSLLSENHLLREGLEREKFRRKHLEQQTQQLYSKLLETQQQLAVVSSTDRKKDVMIEQLDKTLAQVVEGWKKHEKEKMSMINKLKEERESSEKSYKRQEQVLTQFEKELAQAVEALTKEQERAVQAERDKESQLRQQTQEREKLLELLSRERDHLKNVEEERDHLLQQKNNSEKENSQVQTTLCEERENWHHEREELESRLGKLIQEHRKNLEEEKRKTLSESHKREDAEAVLASVQKDLQQMEIDMDTLKREKENMRMEISLVEAKCEANKVKQETDRQAGFEKKIQELNRRHKEELEQQLGKFHEEMKHRDTKFKATKDDYEERLNKAEETIHTLVNQGHQFENQRKGLTLHLQKMLQNHCAEAIQLISNKAGSSQNGLQGPQSPPRQVVGGSVDDLNSIATSHHHGNKGTATNGTTPVRPRGVGVGAGATTSSAMHSGSIFSTGSSRDNNFLLGMNSSSIPLNGLQFDQYLKPNKPAQERKNNFGTSSQISSAYDVEHTRQLVSKYLNDNTSIASFNQSQINGGFDHSSVLRNQPVSSTFESVGSSNYSRHIPGQVAYSQPLMQTLQNLSVASDFSRMSEVKDSDAMSPLSEVTLNETEETHIFQRLIPGSSQFNGQGNPVVSVPARTGMEFVPLAEMFEEYRTSEQESQSSASSPVGSQENDTDAKSFISNSTLMEQDIEDTSILAPSTTSQVESVGKSASEILQEQQNQRQQELAHYIQMLKSVPILQPGLMPIPSSGKPDTLSNSLLSPIKPVVQNVNHADQSMKQPVGSDSVTKDTSRKQVQTEVSGGQAFSKRTVMSSQPQVSQVHQPQEPVFSQVLQKQQLETGQPTSVPRSKMTTPKPTDPVGPAHGALTPQQVGELSRLLGLYNNTTGQVNITSEQLYAYLREHRARNSHDSREREHSRQQQEISAAKPKRNIEQQFDENRKKAQGGFGPSVNGHPIMIPSDRQNHPIKIPTDRPNQPLQKNHPRVPQPGPQQKLLPDAVTAQTKSSRAKHRSDRKPGKQKSTTGAWK